MTGTLPFFNALRTLRIVFTIMVLLVGVAFSHRALLGEESGDAQIKVVEVSGAGVDIDSAKKDAYREAVRQVVGAYLSSETRTENDELIEDKVISLSSGFVETAETLKESTNDGLVRVRIRATVRVGKVLDSLKSHNISVGKIDGESLDAKLLTKQDQTAGFADLTTAALKGYPLPCFKASVLGEPRLGEKRNDGNIPLFVSVKIEPDLDAFVTIISKMDKALALTPRPSGSWEVDHALCGWESQARASSNMINDIRYNRDNGRGFTQYPITALSYIDGDNAFPVNIYSGQLNAPFTEAQPVAVMFPIKFLGKGRRSSWKWYLMTYREAEQAFQPLLNTIVRCRATLCDKQDQQLAIKTWDIAGLGSGGMRKIDPQGSRGTFVLAPGYVSSDGAEFIVGHFTGEIEFILAEEEVAELTNVTVELQ